MTKYLFISLVAIVLLSAVGCKKDPPVVPPVEKPTHPQIDWTVDTIHNLIQGEQLLFNGIWGTSFNNVYACGHNSLGKAVLWHFNGKDWSDVKINISQGGIIQGPIYLSAICGFNENDIYVVGSRGVTIPTPPGSADSSIVIHFNGFMWKDINDNMAGREASSIFCYGSNKIIVVGIEGEISDFDGSSWTLYNPYNKPNLFSVGGNINRQFVSGLKYSPPNSHYVIYSRHNNTDWALMDSIGELENKTLPRFGIKFYSTETNRVYSAWYGIFAFEDSVWKKVYSDGKLYSTIAGTGNNNIFCAGPGGALIHYNGVDWETIDVPGHFLDKDFIDGMWVDKENIFITAFNVSPDDQSYVIRGNIKN